jgi:hypothetical protein
LLNKATGSAQSGINCFRFSRAVVSRLIAAPSVPIRNENELRRYFAYLEHSIDKGTQ